MRNLQARSEIPLALSSSSPPLLAATRHRRSTAAAALVLLLGSGMALIGSETSASANDQVCSGLTSGKIDVSGSTKTVTVTAPDGYLITGYCVKAGSVQQGNGPRYVTLSSQMKTVPFGHPSGKDVSHYSYSYEPIKTPPTPTPPVDVCPNMPGNQPHGTNCNPPPPMPAVDVCPNMTGNQPHGTNCNPPPPMPAVDVCPNMTGNQPAGTNCNPTPPVVKGKKPYAKIVTRCTGVTKFVLVNRRLETMPFTLHGRGFHKVVRVKADATRTVRTDLPNNTRAWVKVEGRTFSARVPGRCFIAAPTNVGSGV